MATTLEKQLAATIAAAEELELASTAMSALFGLLAGDVASELQRRLSDLVQLLADIDEADPKRAEIARAIPGFREALAAMTAGIDQLAAAAAPLVQAGQCLQTAIPKFN